MDFHPLCREALTVFTLTAILSFCHLQSHSQSTDESTKIAEIVKQAKSLLNANENDSADKLLSPLADSLYNKRENLDSTHYDVFYDYGNLLYRTGKYQKSTRIYKKASQVAELLKDKEKIINPELSASASYYYLQKLDSSMMAIEKAEKIALELGDSSQIAKALLNKTSILSSRGEKDKLYKALMKALEIAPKDFFMQKALYNQMGVYQYQSGQVDSAIFYFKKSVELAAKAKDTASLAIYYNNIANILTNSERFKSALKTARKGLEFRKASGSPKGVSSSYVTLGRVFDGLNLYDSAVWAYNNALYWNNKLDAVLDLSIAHNNKAVVFLEQEKLDSAYINFMKALEIKNMNKNEAGRSPIYTGLAKYFFKKGKRDTAYALLQKARNYINEDDYRLLSAHYEDKMDFAIYSGSVDSALHFKNKFLEYRDSLTRSERDRRIDGLITQFRVKEQEFRLKDLEQKNEIVQLNLSVTNQKLVRKQGTLLIMIALLVVLVILLGLLIYSGIKQKKLNKAVSIRNKHLQTLNREIFHRTKNHYQTLSSLLSAQKHIVKDAEAHGLIQDNENRVHAMQLIHKELFGDEKLENVPLKPFLKEISENLAFAFKQEHTEIILEVEDSIIIESDRAIPLSISINEVLTNAFKYGCNSDNPIIKISADVKNGILKLKISDNGSGFNSEIKRSFGIELIHILTEQMNGTVEFKNQDGALVCLTLPWNGKKS